MKACILNISANVASHGDKALVHANPQTHDNLHSLMLTVSRRTLQRLLNQLTEDFDKEVLEWKQQADKQLQKEYQEVLK